MARNRRGKNGSDGGQSASMGASVGMVGELPAFTAPTFLDPAGRQFYGDMPPLTDLAELEDLYFHFIRLYSDCAFGVSSVGLDLIDTFLDQLYLSLIRKYNASGRFARDVDLVGSASMITWLTLAAQAYGCIRGLLACRGASNHGDNGRKLANHFSNDDRGERLEASILHFQTFMIPAGYLTLLDPLTGAYQPGVGHALHIIMVPNANGTSFPLYTYPTRVHTYSNDAAGELDLDEVLASLEACLAVMSSIPDYVRIQQVFAVSGFPRANVNRNVYHTGFKEWGMFWLRAGTYENTTPTPNGLEVFPYNIAIRAPEILAFEGIHPQHFTLFRHLLGSDNDNPVGTSPSTDPEFVGISNPVLWNDGVSTAAEVMSVHDKAGNAVTRFFAGAGATSYATYTDPQAQFPWANQAAQQVDPSVNLRYLPPGVTTVTVRAQALVKSTLDIYHQIFGI